MISIITTSAVALVLFGSTLASAQYVPGSDATSRANGYTERLKVAAGYPDAAAPSTVRNTTFGYPAAERTTVVIPGSDASLRQADEAARASVQRRISQ
ncbi:hypothetical protein GTW51_14650 [Aurantimonas aggregata]|uniref:DUF4148 domain-containing protein n=1 Tax=Aurantimonas aggregata TaxID=2047720 RepID=A0A6L9MJE2_9HYPH|nr:hypothetical protein [Aurantimonas aggregata]NDV87943.1 hypothetical protein [Aurantimonas aggregata]